MTVFAYLSTGGPPRGPSESLQDGTPGDFNKMWRFGGGGNPMLGHHKQGAGFAGGRNPMLRQRGRWNVA